MFHLEHNRERGFFDWSELRCLCRALGFQPDLITANLPAEVDQTEDGMTIKDILRIINLKYLDLAVDKTFNAHTADWNLCVFKKAFVLLDHRVLTYQELHDIRVAFCAYEHQDLKGMEMDDNTIMRCLKMCGRIIAPLKMNHRIKHMSQMFDEEGRIQLYEFLDLILWTELYNSHRPFEPVVTNAKSKNSAVYQVEDFHHIIQHYDERLAQYLNELYLHEEWSFGKEEFSKQKLPNELPVHRDFRLKNMDKARKHYRSLKNDVTKSQNTVHITSTGHIRPRPLTAPNVEKYDQSEKSSIYTAHSQHRLSVADMVRDYIHTPASRLVRSASPRMKKRDQRLAKMSPAFAQLDYDSVEPAVTTEQRLARDHELQNLKFHISTLENRYEQKLQKDLQVQLPHYTPRPKVEEDIEEEPPKPKPKAMNPALLPDHIDRLAYAPYRPVPKTSHAQHCDARFRGWHKVKTTKGPHYVLTTSAFSDNPNAQLQRKLYEDSCKVVKTVKGDCTVRRTTAGNVRPEVVRPSASKSYRKDSKKAPPQEEINIEPEQLTKTTTSSARTLSGGLDAIKRGCDSRKHSAGHSAGTSSGKTYSFNDFKLYSEQYDKPAEKVEEDASNLMDAAPIIVIHKASTTNLSLLGDATDILPTTGRRYSQFTGGAIAKEITERVEGDIASRQHSKKVMDMKIKKFKNFAERRNLSGFVRKRLIDSASNRSTALSAC